MRRPRGTKSTLSDGLILEGLLIAIGVTAKLHTHPCGADIARHGVIMPTGKKIELSMSYFRDATHVAKSVLLRSAVFAERLSRLPLSSTHAPTAPPASLLKTRARSIARRHVERSLITKG